MSGARGARSARFGARARRADAIAATATYSGTVDADSDDGFQDIAGGAVTIADAEVRLGRDFSGNANVAGFRFASVTIAPALAITYAHLRFTAAVTNSPAVTFRVWGVKAANPGTFTSAAFDLSGRAKTTAYVDWEPPAWTEGQKDAGTTTPNLATIVQELVDQGSYVSGNAMAFLIEWAPGYAGTAVRGAWSHYAYPSRAAELAINTLEPPVVTPPETPVEGAYYISRDGSDANAGTIASPWRTITKAASVLTAGDTVYLRAGVYDVEGTDTYLSERAFANGTAQSPITVASYPGERAVFDGFGHAWHPRTLNDGRDINFPWLFTFRGDFIRIQNIDFRGGVGRGVGVAGNDCTFSGCRFYKNHGDALYAKWGTSLGDGVYTLGNRHVVEDCDAFDNNSVSNGGNSASGIKLPYNRDGIVRRCRFWNNSDDGLDLYGARVMLVEDCLSFNNGYGSTGNGMGFKLGGSSGDTGGTLARRCISSRNNTYGFDANAARGVIVENCTSWDDRSAGFQMRGQDDVEPGGVVRSCISYQSGTAVIKHAITTETLNTWNLGIADPLFASTDSASADFLGLSSGSACRGAGVAGVDVGARQFGVSFAVSSSGIWVAADGGEDRVYS